MKAWIGFANLNIAWRDKQIRLIRSQTCAHFLLTHRNIKMHNRHIYQRNDLIQVDRSPPTPAEVCRVIDCHEEPSMVHQRVINYHHNNTRIFITEKKMSITSNSSLKLDYCSFFNYFSVFHLFLSNSVFCISTACRPRWSRGNVLA